MVVDLFTASATAPVIFDDRASLVELTKNVGRNADVLTAAVFAHADGDPGRPLQSLAEFRREDAQPVARAAIPAAPEVDFRGNDLVVAAPIVDPQGAPIGVAQVVFSLARENDEIRTTQQRVLLASFGLGASLSLLLLFLTRRTIVVPLGRLLRAVRALERGEAAATGVRGNDEVGVLATAFERMASTIRDREDRLSDRNRDMRLLLDNVNQGFFTVDRDERMSAERSAIVDTWFGAPTEGMKVSAFLGRVDPEVGQWFALGHAACVEDILPLEVCIAQLPVRFRKGETIYSLSYHPIFEDGQWARILIVVSDVTSEVERERASRAAHDMLAVFERMSDDPAGFAEFFREATTMVQRVVRGQGDRVSIRRDLHTLKGNAGLFGIVSVASKCHELEGLLDEGAELTPAQCAELKETWATIESLYARLGGRTASRIEIDDADFFALVDGLKRRVDGTKLLSTVSQWRNEPAGRRLARVADHARVAAKRLGKGDIDIEVDASLVRIPPLRWAPFWSAFAHVIRNAIDHGIESSEVRLAAGKSARGKLRMSLKTEGEGLLLVFADDGAGIDWEAVRNRAVSRGLPAGTQDELVDALFAEGLTTREEASETSGRGVGLGAVREATSALGGRIRVESTRGVGTVFKFAFPRSALDETTEVRAPLDSLLLDNAVRSSASPQRAV
jgi:two-component system chemotaxis sensor kinase CheA